ncbi:MAG: adenylate kinase [Frankia sp.]
MRLVLLGPPGSGKGTQAARLSARLGVPAISTGQIFESNIEAGTPLGRQAESYVRRGELVPDDVVLEMVRERLLSGPDCAQGFILDGFPRTLPQAKGLDRYLAAACGGLDAVIDLDVDDSEVLERIAGRARIEGRVDDTRETALNRLKVFSDETAPLRRYYAERGLLVSVDGTGSPDDVANRIGAALTAREKSRPRLS